MVRDRGLHEAIMNAESKVLLGRIDQTLRQSAQLKWHEFQVDSAEGHITVRGAVPSFYHKQVAQELIRRIEGVTRVENQLKVHWKATAAEIA